MPPSEPLPELPADGTKLRVLCGTWNLGGGMAEATLEKWLLPGKFDIVAVGAQEVESRPGVSMARERPR